MKKYALFGPVGKLARWLRLLGFDVDYSEKCTEELMKEALERGRIPVVKGGRWKNRPVEIGSNAIEDQIVEFLEATGERLREDLFFSRCSLCNGSLVRISRFEAEEKGVPEYVLVCHSDFKLCNGCGKVYWPGSHRKRFFDMVEKISGKLKADG